VEAARPDNRGAPSTYTLRAEHEPDSSVKNTGVVEQPIQDVIRVKHDLTNVFAAIAGGVQLMMKSNIEDQNFQRILIHLETAVQSGLQTLDRLRDTPED